MKEYQTVKIQEQKLKKVVCDVCGYVEDQSSENWFLHDRDMISIDHNFGFGGNRDGGNLKVDICENCLFELMKENSIKYRYLDRF